jgi:transcription elongation factor Elf1
MSEFRVIYHARTCPDCGSDDVTEHDVEITDGSTETALTCGACGAAWPVACIAEQLEPAAPGVRP